MEEGRDGGRGMDRGRKDGVDMKGGILQLHQQSLPLS